MDNVGGESAGIAGDKNIFNTCLGTDLKHNQIPMVSFSGVVKVPLGNFVKEECIRMLHKYREFAWKNGCTLNDLNKFILEHFKEE